MPTYEYECSSCHDTFEVRQRISEPPLESCRRCGGPVRRVISPAPFILKGTGFYVNDYPSEARKKALSEEKKATPEKTPSDAGASSTSSSASAPPATTTSSS